MERVTGTSLHRYVEVDEHFYENYEAYQADEQTLARIHEVQPTAHVITPSRYTCGDCLRNIPRMTRIAEFLPSWTWEIYDSTSNAERSAALGITNIPTFIVYDSEGGSELGRIVENPVSGSLETDLLHIVGLD